jgi:DNA-binding XRE family transcriptional regulator
MRHMRAMMRRPIVTDLDDLLEQINAEAEAEGESGRAHLESLRDHVDLAVQIIDRRRVLHMTQEQVAAAAGLHQSVVSRIEQGVANPTARTLALLARARLRRSFHRSRLRRPSCWSRPTTIPERTGMLFAAGR